MVYRKICLTLLVSTPFFLGMAIAADADTVKENVSVFYENEAGKKLILQKANSIDEKLDNIDAVIGDFSKDDIRAMEASDNIKVVHTQATSKKLTTTTSTLPTLQYANFTTNWSQSLVQARLAWQAGLNGNGIKVGMIDAEVAAHSNLPTIHRKNFATDPNLKADASKHGTFVAGIIVAKPLINGQMFGTSPAVDLYSMNVDGDGGGDLNDIITAIDYAIEQKLQIVNISMGISKKVLLDPDELLSESPLYIAIKKAQQAGILFVAASGNNGNGVDYPAAFDGVIGVGSITSTKAISTFSNEGAEVDVVAPGSVIQSLSYVGGFRNDSGTSFATPYVTGLLALLKQQFPKETNAQLVQRLTASVEDLGEAGFDTKYGYGLAKYTEQPTATPKLVTTSALETEAAEAKPVEAKPVETKPVVVETAAQKYVRSNKTKIATITKKIINHKKLNYLTEYTPMYSVYSNLTKTQKIALVSYRKEIIPSIISGKVKSTRIFATNINILKTKKTSKITFGTAVKASTIQSSAFAMYKDGTKVSNFKMTKAANGKSVTIKTTKALTKGTYYLAIDTTKFRTTKNKAVRPYMVTYVVK